LPKPFSSYDLEASAPTREGVLARIFGKKLKMRMRILISFGLAVMVVVPVNALFLQEGRHPAPLFRLISFAPEAPRATAPAVPQRPAAAPAKVESSKPEPKTESAKKASGGADAIADLIDGRMPRSDAKPRQSKDAIGDEIAHLQPDKTVIFAQRALAKLGFSLHEDGVLGGTTRQAIEKFERANGMPVKGELSPKILKLLSQRSGLAMR